MPTQRMRKAALDIDVHTLARERMAHVFDTFDHVIVAFSGGKDSTALLNVALEVAASHPRFARHLPLRVMHHDEEAIPYETEEYVRRVAQRPDVDLEWYCLPLKHRNACSRKSPWWHPWAPEHQDLWCRPLPPEGIQTLPGFPVWPVEARLTAPHTAGLMAGPERGNTVVLMGIRAQESLMRVRMLTKPGTEHNWIRKYSEPTSRGNMWNGYPIYDWTTEDVWTAPAVFGWDYNRAYDRLEMAGVSAHAQRCSPAFGEEPLQKLHTYAACFPEVWDKMVDRVPGVGAAARYALTELYGYKDRPDKPDDMTWPEFIKHYVGKFRPGDAAGIADRIGEEIRRHYRVVTMPIAPTAPCPPTGMSWRFALTLAMRGDLKGRKQALANVPSIKDENAIRKAWQKYHAEIQTALDEGTWGALGHPRPAPASGRALDLIPADRRHYLVA